MSPDHLAEILNTAQIDALNQYRCCDFCSRDDRLLLAYYGLIKFNDVRDGGRDFDPTTRGLVVRAISVNRPLASA